MRRLRVALAVASLLGSLTLVGAPVQAADPGQDAFLANKCNKCHTIEKFNIAKLKAEAEQGGGDEADNGKKKPPDLSHVGKERDHDWIIKWLNREVELDGKKHRKKWTGTPEQQEAIAKWLSSLK